MPLLTTNQRTFAKAVSDLVYCNPFLPQRMECEKRALGRDFDPSPPVWSREADVAEERPNIVRIHERVDSIVVSLREKLIADSKALREDLELYEDLCLYWLYERYRNPLHEAIDRAMQTGRPIGQLTCWQPFARDFQRLLNLRGVTLVAEHQPAHVFACFFQIRRAFFNIFHALMGRSMPAAQLRAAIWQSIFTHDLRRYYRSLHRSMADFTTLITGESGTGKELVARAIGHSRYIPFNPQTLKFDADFASSFYPLNLSALSPTLIESELFGHKRGAFTGAVADRAGWLEVCPPLGTVFLDEVGELDPAIQVKLLRVLQTRTFQRIGETTTRKFQGKLMAATNRDLSTEIAAGQFRADFYYRLCSDLIRTPSLREQFADCPDDLQQMISFITQRIVGNDAPAIAREVHKWVHQNLGDNYAWPGNFRELEQCVRNVLIRGTYQPARATNITPITPLDQMMAAMQHCELTADELLQRYCTLAYHQFGTYEAAAKQLQLDRRTVGRKLDHDLLAALRAG